MADRRDYYFRQKVTEAELDSGFDGLEQADFALAVDNDLIGIVAGLGVAEAAIPNLTVDVQGPGTAYSKAGERIAIASTQNQDVSVDDGALSTAVGVPGNEKWVSLFILFDRALSDPRIDGNSVSVFFVRDESFAFSVVQGAEAPLGTAARPALDSGKILLADIHRTFGQTQIVNADIDVTRREDAYRLTGTVPLVAGTPKEAIEDLLTALNQHIDGVANQHPADELTYAGSGTWAGGITGLPAGSVENALDQVVVQLAAIVNPSGGERVGTRALVGTWADGSTFLSSSVWGVLNKIVTDLGSTGINGALKVATAARSAWLGGRTNPADTVFAALDKIITDLAATTGTDDGAERIGAAAGTNLAAGSVRSQLDELDAEKAGLALANAFAALNTFDAGIDVNGSETLSGNLTLDGSTSTIAFTARAETAATQAALISDNRVAGTFPTEFFKIFQGTAGSDIVRIFFGGNGSGIVITGGADFDNSTNEWVSDDATDAAIWEFYPGLGGEMAIRYRDVVGAGERWGNGAWTGALYHFDVVATADAEARLSDGIVSFFGVSGTSQSNPAAGTVPGANALYALNTPDAWLKGINNTGEDDSFGIASMAANGSGSTVTYDHSAGGTFQQVHFATANSGTSATTAGFMTAVPGGVNTVVVRRWRWDGAAIVETTLGDWSLLRFGRITS